MVGIYLVYLHHVNVGRILPSTMHYPVRKVDCGFSLSHNKIRHITASLLRETCRDVRIEPCLQHLTGETFEE